MVLFVFVVCFACFPWSLTGSCPSVALVVEAMSNVSLVSPVSLAAKGLLGCGVSGVFLLFESCCFGLFVPLFSFFAS